MRIEERKIVPQGVFTYSLPPPIHSPCFPLFFLPLCYNIRSFSSAFSLDTLTEYKQAYHVYSQVGYLHVREVNYTFI